MPFIVSFRFKFKFKLTLLLSSPMFVHYARSNGVPLMVEKKRGASWWTTVPRILFIATIIVVLCFLSTPIDPPVDSCLVDSDMCSPVWFLPLNSTAKAKPSHTSNNTFWISDNVHAVIPVVSPERNEVWPIIVLCCCILCCCIIGVLVCWIHDACLPEHKIVLEPYQPMKKRPCLTDEDFAILSAAAAFFKLCQENQNGVIDTPRWEVEQEAEEEVEDDFVPNFDDIILDLDDLFGDDGFNNRPANHDDVNDIPIDLRQPLEDVLQDDEGVLASASALAEAHYVLSDVSRCGSVLWKGSFMWDPGGHRSMSMMWWVLKKVADRLDGLIC